MRPVFPPQIRWNLDLDFDAPEPESVDRARLHDNLIASPHHFEPSVLQRILRLIALILIGVDGYAFSLPFPIQDYPLALGYGLIFQDQIAIVPPADPIPPPCIHALGLPGTLMPACQIAKLAVSDDRRADRAGGLLRSGLGK